MNLRRHEVHPIGRRPHGVRGSVLVIVMWIAFGLVSIALYFGHSMAMASRAADNYAAGVAAEQAIEGAARYLSYVLTNQVLSTTNWAMAGVLPDTNVYLQAGVAVGDATFWIIGRTTNDVYPTDQPVFGLVDEASKLNLNTATLSMLEMLPNMTPEFAASIVNWRSPAAQATAGGAESDYYQHLNPPYYAKNAPFETVDELQLVQGATADLLYGEDLNLNGVLDPNENDGPASPPYDDNADGILNPGILEYVTVYSREPNRRADGSQRIDINTPEAGGPGGGRGGGGGGGGTGNTNTLRFLLSNTLGASRANQILSVAPAGAGYTSVLEYYYRSRSRMTLTEFAEVADALSVTNSDYLEGLVNVNTAPAPVLACLPGIGPDKALALVAYRQIHGDQLTSVAWVSQVLDQANAIQAGPYLTVHSYQFSADIAAVGPHGRGYRRTLFVFDTSTGAARVVYRRDLGALGWALGNVRQNLLLAQNRR